MIEKNILYSIQLGIDSPLHRIVERQIAKGKNILHDVFCELKYRSYVASRCLDSYLGTTLLEYKRQITLTTELLGHW